MMVTTDLLPVLDDYCHYVSSGYARPSRRLSMFVHGKIIALCPHFAVRAEPCDVLLLSPSSSWARRIVPLAEALEREGLSVRQAIQLRDAAVMLRRVYRPSPTDVPVHWRFLMGYAEHLVEAYRPRVVVTFADHDVFSVFLRLAAEQRGAKVVNVAHSILVPHVLKSMFCFDYYLVFGESSVDGASRLKVRMGDSKLVKCGYVLVDRSLQLGQSRDRQAVLFFSTWLYDSRAPDAVIYDQAALQSFGVLSEWARRQRRYRLFVKTHPDENPALIRSYLGDVPGVQILPPDTPIREALKLVSVSVGLVTNAAVESALTRRPFITVFPADVLPNHLELDDFFGPRVWSPGALDEAIEATFTHYDDALANCDRFVRRHLETAFDALAATTRVIVSIHAGREDFPCSPVVGTLEGLRTV